MEYLRFSVTCPLNSIILTDGRFTYLGVRRDHDLPDMDMKLRRFLKKILDGAAINNKSFRETSES